MVCVHKYEELEEQNGFLVRMSVVVEPVRVDHVAVLHRRVRVPCRT